MSYKSFGLCFVLSKIFKCRQTHSHTKCKTFCRFFAHFFSLSQMICMHRSSGFKCSNTALLRPPHCINMPWNLQWKKTFSIWKKNKTRWYKTEWNPSVQWQQIDAQQTINVNTLEREKNCSHISHERCFFFSCQLIFINEYCVCIFVKIFFLLCFQWFCMDGGYCFWQKMEFFKCVCD